MAVDFLHRLIVSGTHNRVRAFRRQIYRAYPRTVAGETWTEIVPFSFAALYELAPAARRIEREIPCDPYELARWPTRRIDSRHAEVRYQFQTRNLEMQGLLRTLSRALPSLTFTVATLCLDDSSVDGFRLARGALRKWTLNQQRHDSQWDRARKKFKLAGEDVYEDADAVYWVEQEMLHDALGHWHEPASRPRPRYNWSNQPALRDLSTERELTLYEVAEALTPEAPRRKRAAKTAAPITPQPLGASL